ncbi:coiled-coil domain-containing protein 28A isoform X6 [Bactrocera dorsalis]|uniref:Coiled-coil domain-containing protein 28A isoform X6 n=1 Tax=Bactrocera dorsalis TaxID=27457 RepID=A0A8N4L4B1_BACDO|nr:coiled-coil domain-containing protein 28A isoform X6 [Bactrocera dorsalis]
METNAEVVERQKLVTNDNDGDEDINNHTTVQKSGPKPESILPTPAVPKMIIKNVSSGDTTRSRNSASCSIERTSEKGHLTSAKVTYINERRTRPNLQISASLGGCNNDERLDFKSRQRKFLKEADICNTDHCASNIPENSSEVYCDSIDFVGSIDPSTSLNTTNAGGSSNVNDFDHRPIKHHSFVSEVPDVKHMERALLGLLDDFHSGKLKAFGSGCTMEQMTKIREQQESLAKLHFELAAAEEDSLESVHDLNAAKAQENMLQLVQRLEQLSVSIEQLQSSHLGL